MRRHRSTSAICCERTAGRLKRKRRYALRRALIRCSRRLGTTFPTCWTSRAGRKPQSSVAAPAYTDAMFNLALLLQRGNKHAEAAEYWRHYLANDAESEWAARARRSLKFCEMQVHILNS